MSRSATPKQKKRLFYLAVFFVLLAVECAIALWVRDRFVRPYLGDVLVTWCVYAFIRILLPEKPRLLPLYVFFFCLAVELSQLLPLLEWLGLENSGFLRVLLGSVFDPADVACYFTGCLLLGLWELLRWRQARRPS